MNKIPTYRKSMYKIVQDHLKEHPSQWEKENAVSRKEAELKKLLTFLFDETAQENTVDEDSTQIS